MFYTTKPNMLRLDLAVGNNGVAWFLYSYKVSIEKWFVLYFMKCLGPKPREILVKGRPPSLESHVHQASLHLTFDVFGIRIVVEVSKFVVDIHQQFNCIQRLVNVVSRQTNQRIFQSLLRWR